jgi:ribonuclease D
MMPTNVIELKRIKSLQSKSYRQFSERLITCVNSFEYEKKADFQRVDAPVKGDDLVMYRKLKAVIASVSEETEIPAQLLGSRKMLESLVIHCHRNNNQDLTIEFKGWRASLLGLKFSEILFCDN